MIGTNSITDRYCGGELNAENGNTSPGSIVGEYNGNYDPHIFNDHPKLQKQKYSFSGASRTLSDAKTEITFVLLRWILEGRPK